MSALTLSPVSAGVYTALNVAGMTALLGGTAPTPHDTDVPQTATLPTCWFVVTETNARGFGMGSLRRIDLRVHAAGQGSATLGAAKQVQGILAQAVSLLEDASVTVSGYRMAGPVFYESTSEPLPSEIASKPCWEALANFYFWVEV